MKNLYRIAGLNVQIDSFGRTLAQAEPYRVQGDGPADIVVRSNWAALKEKYSHLSDDDGEYIFTGSSFYRQLLEHDGIMLHSSAVVVDGKAYLFTADSGTGKSTHTTLWLKMLGERAYILNDDKPALRLEGGKWFAYGTPWSGKYDISCNRRAELGGIAVVERSEVNSIEFFREKSIIPLIYKQVNRPGDMFSRIKILELLDQLLKTAPVWKLKCNMDMEAAEMAYAAMSGKDSE